MGKEAAIALTFLVTLASQHALGFNVAAPGKATSTRWFQQQHQQHHRSSVAAPATANSALWTSRRSMGPLTAAADDGGEGFDVTEEKLSRKAKKRAKARGESPGSKKATQKQQPQEVSMAVVAEVLRKQGLEPNSNAAAASKAIENMEKEEQKRITKRQARIESVMAAKLAAEQDPDAGSIPEIVSNRMLSRMIPFFLLPAFGGIGLFVAVYVLSHQYDYTIPAYIVAYVTQATFLIALLGITYAILSASWDEDREGTFFGVDEVKRNFGNIVEGLRRSSDRMDVEDLIAEEENTNRYQRRQQQKNDDLKPGP